MSRPFPASRSFFVGRTVLFLLAGVVGVACSPPPQPRKIEMEPIGTLKNVPTTPLDDPSDGGVTTPNSGTPPPGSSVCSGTDFDNLLEILSQCEVTVPRASDVPSIKDKVEVKVAATPTSITPGGRIDLQVTLRNKTSDPIALYFSGEPSPRFDVEVIDARGRRVDVPSAKWPGYPKGFKPEPRDTKVSKIILEKNGTARIKVAWDAFKMKWSPDKARVWEGRGYPRSQAGPLNPGKYSVRVVLPILGDLGEIPKTPVEVGS